MIQKIVNVLNNLKNNNLEPIYINLSAFLRFKGVKK